MAGKYKFVCFLLIFIVKLKGTGIMLSNYEIAKFCYMYCTYAVPFKKHWTNVPRYTQASIKKDTLVEYNHYEIVAVMYGFGLLSCVKRKPKPKKSIKIQPLPAIFMRTIFSFVITFSSMSFSHNFKSLIKC